MRDYLLDLQKLGLSDKEAKVYLASLTIGPDTAQNIAKRSGVNRATTYVAIKSLEGIGLISTFNKDKKQYFVASRPDNLFLLYDKESASLVEKRAITERLISELKPLYQKPEKEAVVRYFEGKDGLMAMVKELLRESNQQTLRVVVPVDLHRKVFSPEERAKLQEFKLKKGIKTRVLYTKSDGEWPSSGDNERKSIPGDRFPISCDMVIYPDKVRIASLGEKVSGILIEDKEIAKTLRAIFDLAWGNARS